LSRTHTIRQLGLCETSANARRDQFAGESEFFVQSGIRRPDFAVNQHLLLHRIQTPGHGVISLILLRAASIARCGVF
jgi:hypothetical protein